ncbi:MAG: Zn-dependent oligopeptidase [Phycisphaerales bacterium]|nr:Zn-dependent oligopeptidase [Phycisphaerales bacterium]
MTRLHSPNPLPAWMVTLLMSITLLAPAAVASEIPPDSPIAPAVAAADAAIAAIVAVPDAQRDYANTLGALDDAVTRLQTDVMMTIFMAYVSTDATERDRGQLAEEHLNTWVIALNKREDLYRAVKALATSSPTLTPEQQRYLDHTLRDFRRAGMELTPEKRDQLKALELEENKVTLDFEKNIRDDETIVPLSAAELPDVPEAVLARVPRVGDVYLCGLDAPTYMAIMNFCTREPTRAKMYIAYKRKGGKRNIALLEKILQLRAQRARLLGYPHIADYNTEPRMVKNAATVLAFYEKLRPIIRKKALADFEEYRRAKAQASGDPNAVVQAWDQFFLDNWLLRNKFAVDAQRVQEYFPMERVVEGLFAVTQKLYGLEYKDVTEAARAAGRRFWHDTVKLYEVWDVEKQTQLGEFYWDPFPRDNKYGHFAVFPLQPRKVWADGSLQRPTCAVVCNFPPPSAERPSLMTHEDVETLFHEFGHALHNILTEATIGGQSGTSTALDFVELPSQMFENWVWDAGVLGTFARHYRTGEPIPPDLLKSMLAARNVSSAVKAERQVYYGMLDLTYHMTPDGKLETTRIANELMESCELFPFVPETYVQAGFNHLTGYAAGYYGYLWSDVYAQDVFTVFEQGGVLSPEVGRRWRSAVLARGGTVDEMQMLVDFLGREPRMEPFLKYLGLEE